MVEGKLIVQLDNVLNGDEEIIVCENITKEDFEKIRKEYYTNKKRPPFLEYLKQKKVTYYALDELIDTKIELFS